LRALDECGAYRTKAGEGLRWRGLMARPSNHGSPSRVRPAEQLNDLVARNELELVRRDPTKLNVAREWHRLIPSRRNYRTAFVWTVPCVAERVGRSDQDANGIVSEHLQSQRGDGVQRAFLFAAPAGGALEMEAPNRRRLGRRAAGARGRRRCLQAPYRRRRSTTHLAATGEDWPPI